MNLLSDRILGLEESATIKMAQLSRELAAEGKAVISLSLGEPDFDTPAHICDAAKKAIDEGYTHYTPVSGYLELRQAICQKLKRDNHLNYKPNQIVVSTGAKHSLINAILCMVNPGDEVIVPTPFWVSYAAMIQLADGNMVNIGTDVENDFKITPDQLRRALTPRTKLLMLNSPSNPTGSVYTEDELKALAKVLKDFPEVFIISDEIYEYITFGIPHYSFAQIEGMYDRTAIINGVSKGFAMTGWRLGFLAAPEWLAKACDKLQGQYTSGTSSITQKAAETAFSSSLDSCIAMRETFLKRRDIVLDILSDVEGFKISKPEGAFYIFPDVSSYFGKKHAHGKIENSEDFAMYLLREAHVAVVAGSAFGDDRCLRISFATSEDKLRDAMLRIKEVLAKLN